MRISAKGRYGLAVLTSMAKTEGTGKLVTILSLSERLSISKIYLEQVFVLLKRSGLVAAFKGPQGGYSLTRSPKNISVFDILSATETAVFEKTGTSTSDEAIEIALNEMVFDVLDNSVREALSGISLESLAEKSDGDFMYYL